MTETATLERRRRHRLYSALVARAVQGSVFYPVALGILLFTTDWITDHRTLGLALFGAGAVTGTIRLVYLKWLLAHPESWQDGSPRLLTPVLFAPTMAFGLFAGATLMLYGVETTTTVLAILTVMGFATGGTSSLAMSRQRHVIFLLTLFAPFGGAAVSLGTAAGRVVALLVVLLLVFLLKEGKAANSAWVALGEKTLELEAAVEDLEVKQAEVVQAHGRTRIVLDNIEEGMCVIDPAGFVRSETSRAFDELVGSAEIGVRLSEHIGDPEFGKWLDLGTDMLTEGLLPAEVALDQFPTTLQRNGRFLDVRYRLLGEGDGPRPILVVMTDVTVQRELQKADQQQQELLHLFKLLTNDPDGFREFRRSGRALVDRVVTPSGSRADLLRHLHTLKGNAAVMGVESIATLCHELEDELSLTEGAQLDAEQATRLEEAWVETAQQMASILGERGDVIELSAEEHEQLSNLVAANAPHEALARVVQGFGLESVPRRLDRLAAQARQTARRLGKDVDVRVDARPLRLDPERWRDLWLACVHLMRNSLDHGIEDAAERRASGKDEQGHLALTVTADDETVRISVRDDGRGIDWRRVSSRASKAGLPADSPQDLKQALFVDGLSTRDVVSALSGRGVGLGAVAKEVEVLGGRVEVHSEPGQGTEVILQVPLGEGEVAA